MQGTFLCVWSVRVTRVKSFPSKSCVLIDKQTGETVESGGCEDEYRFKVGTHPVLGNMLPITTNYICDVSFILFIFETNLENCETLNLSIKLCVLNRTRYLRKERALNVRRVVILHDYALVRSITVIWMALMILSVNIRNESGKDV